MTLKNDFNIRKISETYTKPNDVYTTYGIIQLFECEENLIEPVLKNYKMEWNGIELSYDAEAVLADDRLIVSIKLDQSTTPDTGIIYWGHSYLYTLSRQFIDEIIPMLGGNKLC